MKKPKVKVLDYGIILIITVMAALAIAGSIKYAIEQAKAPSYKTVIVPFNHELRWHITQDTITKKYYIYSRKRETDVLIGEYDTTKQKIQDKYR